jgi:hypothetical protein
MRGVAKQDQLCRDCANEIKISLLSGIEFCRKLHAALQQCADHPTSFGESRVDMSLDKRLLNRPVPARNPMTIASSPGRPADATGPNGYALATSSPRRSSGCRSDLRPLTKARARRPERSRTMHTARQRTPGPLKVWRRDIGIPDGRGAASRAIRAYSGMQGVCVWGEVPSRPLPSTMLPQAAKNPAAALDTRHGGRYVSASSREAAGV